MRDVLPGPIEVRAGAVLYCDTIGLRQRQQERSAWEESLFVTIREYDAVGPDEEVVPLIREHTHPIMRQQPGFQGFYAFRDDAEPEHVVSVSLWSSRDAAILAHQRVLEAMAALRHVVRSAPKVTAGAARVIAAAPFVQAST
jgi:heme-degrading monooxygenase HmoA